MNEKNYKKRLEFQQKMLSHQSEQIDGFKVEIEKLKQKLKEKDEIINSVSSLREELSQNVTEVKKCKKQYKDLIDELKQMKKIINEEIYRNRWWLIKFLIR